MTGAEHPDALARLGQQLQRLRKASGQTLRELAATAGLSAHSNLVDYEKGRRIPPRDILRVYEQVGLEPEGSLDSLHAEASAELAERTRGTFHQRQPTGSLTAEPPEPPEPPSDAERPRP